MDNVTYRVRIEGGEAFDLTLKTGKYVHAVFAALAFAGHDALPAVVEIWIPELEGHYGPYFYHVSNHLYRYEIVPCHQEHRK